MKRLRSSRFPFVDVGEVGAGIKEEVEGSPSLACAPETSVGLVATLGKTVSEAGETEAILLSEAAAVEPVWTDLSALAVCAPFFLPLPEGAPSEVTENYM